jgi:3-methylcrotonyl-CoA carboxylase alpha subunit
MPFHCPRRRSAPWTLYQRQQFLRHTRFITRFKADLLPAAATPPASAIAALLLDSLLQQQAAAEQRRLASSEPNSPWHGSSGWRLNEPYHQL